MAKGTLEESAKFAAKLIKKNPDISMAELQKAAKPKGIRIYPLAIGKAKVSLGMGRKKASKKKARKKTAKRKTTRKKTTKRKSTQRKTTRKKATARRGPGRPKGSKAKRRGPGRPRGSKARRAPGRPRKAANTGDALSHIASRMKELERDNAALRQVMERMADLIARV